MATYFFPYEWRPESQVWVGLGWKQSKMTCEYIAQSSVSNWYAIYSSKTMQLVGNTLLAQPQAYGAMCAGVVMPSGIAVPGWQALTAPPPNQPKPNPMPSPPPTIPPPPPPPPPPPDADIAGPILIGAAALIGIGLVVWGFGGMRSARANKELSLDPYRWRGLSRGRRPRDFSARALQQGTRVEMEHTNDRALARRIAMDHLVEDRNYYKKLSHMESGTR